MLISPTSPAIARPAAPRVAIASPSPQTLAPSQDRWQPSAAPEESDGIKWGPALALTGGMAAMTGLAASGLGVYSAVPAFVVGGFLGGALVANSVTGMLGGSSSNTAAGVGGFLALVGGGYSGVLASGLAMNLGSPMIGLGAGVVAALGSACYLAKST